MAPQSVLVVGGSGGFGSALVKLYADKIGGDNVFATVRSSAEPDQFPTGVNVIGNVDVSQKDCGEKIVDGLKGRAVQVVIYVSGILKTEVRSCFKLIWPDSQAGARLMGRNSASRIGTTRLPCILSAPLLR